MCGWWSGCICRQRIWPYDLVKCDSRLCPHSCFQSESIGGPFGRATYPFMCVNRQSLRTTLLQKSFQATAAWSRACIVFMMLFAAVKTVSHDTQARACSCLHKMATVLSRYSHTGHLRCPDQNATHPMCPCCSRGAANATLHGMARHEPCRLLCKHVAKYPPHSGRETQNL